MFTGFEMLAAVIGTILIVVGVRIEIERPKKKGHDYYILKMWNLIDPYLYGPFEFDDCQEKLEAYREDPEQSQNSFTEIRVSKGAGIDV